VPCAFPVLVVIAVFVVVVVVVVVVAVAVVVDDSADSCPPPVDFVPPVLKTCARLESPIVLATIPEGP
jgi:hypothetical protein